MLNVSLLSRLAALLLLAAGIWSAWAFIERPLLGAVSQDRADIAQDTALIRENGSKAALTGQRRRLVQWDEAIAAASWKLDHASPELISAQLQHLVQGFANQAGASIASFRALPVQVGKLVDVIGLEFEVNTSAAGLRALLFSIETARPRIFVDRLAIQAPETGNTGQPGTGNSGQLGTGNTSQSDLTVLLHLTICALPRPAGAG